MKLNLPNQLTLIRLLLALLFILLLSQYSQRQPVLWMLDTAAIIFIVAAVTDILDGHIARKHGLTTTLGRVLDPLADKVLVCGAFILLAGSNFVDGKGINVSGVAGWMVVVIVLRELIVTGLRGFSESQGRSFAASLHGKVKMWTQSITVPVVLIYVAHREGWFAHEAFHWFRTVFLYVTVAVTALSALQYILRARFILDEKQAA